MPKIHQHGAVINITQGAYLVIENPSANAITRNSGHIVSGGENNVLKWHIGTTTGSYTVPWGYNASYLPVSFTPASATGSGYFLFSTYHTAAQNSTQLPAGVTNINGASGTDNATFPHPFKMLRWLIFRMNCLSLVHLQVPVPAPLRDNFLNQTTPLPHDGSYPFSVTDDPKSKGLNRFTLVFTKHAPLAIAHENGLLTVNYTQGVQWHLNGQPIAGADTHTHMPQSSGQYSAVVNHQGCTLSATREAVVTSTEAPAIRAVQLYPNPASDRVTVRTTDGGNIRSVCMLNPLGMIVHSITPEKPADRIDLNLENVAPGVYYLAIGMEQKYANSN